MPNPKLAACLIVKNAAAVLEPCLHSLLPVIDELVIVDTGSCDQTLELVRQYTDQLYHFDWCDDFSAARNMALGYVQSDWVLLLDADERLSPAAQQLIPQLICEPQWNRQPSILQGHYLHPDGSWSYKHSLFARRFGFAFRGRVHERLHLPDGQPAAYQVYCPELQIVDTGAVSMSKQRWYQELIEAELQTLPDAERQTELYYHLAQALNVQKNQEAARQALLQAVAIYPAALRPGKFGRMLMRQTLQSLLPADPDRALTLAREAAQSWLSDGVEALYYQALAAFWLDQTQLAQNLLKQMTQSRLAKPWRTQILILQARCWLLDGFLSEAQDLLEELHQYADLPTPRVLLISALARQRNWSAALALAPQQTQNPRMLTAWLLSWPDWTNAEAQLLKLSLLDA